MMKKVSILVALCLIATASFCKPEKKLTRVYVDVVGDLFHSGHVEFFKKARSLGDYLIVGVLSDKTVASYKREPVLNMEERVKVISSCKFVDEVIPDCPLGVTQELIDQYHIDLVVHGDDFNEAQAKAQYLPAIEKGIFKLVAYTRGISSTDLMDRIISRYQKAPQSLAKKDFFEGTKSANEQSTPPS